MSFSAIFDGWSALMYPYRKASTYQHTLPQIPEQTPPSPKQQSQPSPTVQTREPSPARPPTRKRTRDTSFSVLDESESQPSPAKKVRFDMARNDILEFDKSKSPRRTVAAFANRQSTKRHSCDSLPWMSGALSRSHRRTGYPPPMSDDAVDSRSDLLTCMANMPFKIVDQQELKGLKRLFHGRFPEWAIGEEFKTTFLGIERALYDTQMTQACNNADGLTYDEVLVGALAKRAGVFLGEEKVQYVENMVLIIGPEDEGFDEEYWSMVWSKGAVWDELAESTKEAIETGGGSRPWSAAEVECDRDEWDIT